MHGAPALCLPAGGTGAHVRAGESENSIHSLGVNSMIKHFFAAITGNIISLIGTLMMVVSLLFIVALLVMQAMGFEGGAYLGILTFVVLPMMFLARHRHGPARHLVAQAAGREAGRRRASPSVTCRSST